MNYFFQSIRSIIITVHTFTVPHRRYASGKFECIIIYGRRRVGKTALINEFCGEKPTIFFSALNAAAQENLEMFSRAICEYKYGSAEGAPLYGSFDDALREITRLSEKERLVLR